MADRAPARSAGRLVFVGALSEAEPAFEVVLGSTAEVAALVTLDPDVGARTPRFVDLAPRAQKRGVPVLRAVGDGDTRSLLPQLRDLAPDLLVCVGWGQPLGPDLLALPPHGAVGFHPSLLPRFRGSAPVHWAILRGETITGNTMVMLTPGVSNGDIVDQREIVIERDDTCGTVYDKVTVTGAQMLREHLPALLAGTAPRRRQVVHHFDRKLPNRTASMDLTSFERTTTEVYNWIRALARPCTGAFAYMRGERVTLWRAVVLPDRRTRVPAGTVLGVDGSGVVVTTTTGAVRLVEVQGEDAPAEPAASWLHRRGLQPGCVFESVDAATLAWTLGKAPRPEPPPDIVPERSTR